MTQNTKLLSYLYSQQIASFSSQYNPKIKVVLEYGKLKLLSAGIRESGPSIEIMFTDTFSHYSLDNQQNLKQILMLGVGGGTGIKLLKQYYPKLVVDAVDIDQTMIDIANEYFGLEQLTDIHYFVSDAQKFVKSAAKKNKKYDLIIIDLYIGFDIPDFVSQLQFLRDIRQLLNSDGKVLINYAYTGAYIRKANDLINLMKKIFTQVEFFQTYSNIEILAS